MYRQLVALFNSYAMGASGLPDIYTQSPRAAGPRVEGVYIRQTMSAHGITIYILLKPYIKETKCAV